MSSSYGVNRVGGDVRDVEFNPFAGPAIVAAVPSTEAQREIWTATQITVDASLAFNESISLRFRGQLRVADLQSAIQALLETHEALRSSFSVDGTTMVVHQAPTVDLPVQNLRDLSPEKRDEQFRATLEKAVTQPFDLTSASLARFELVSLAADEHVLVMTAHHIICDGWSFGVIARDLAALYSELQDRRNPPPPPADRFVDYVATLDSDGSQELADAERYWLNQFTGEVPVLDLPSDRPRPPIKTYNATREDWTLSPPLVRRIKEAAASANASLFTTVLSAFGVLLRRLSLQDDLVIGVPVAGQPATGHVNLVGHCVNMLPIRLRATAGMHFSDLLGQVRTSMMDAVEHQQMTLGSLLRRLPLTRDPSRLPLVSAILNVDRKLDPASMRFAGLEAEMVGNARRYETFDIFINAVESERGLVLECQYNTDLYDRSTIRRWLASYERLLAELADNIHADIDLVPILSAADKEAIALCNHTLAVESRADTIHKLFELQVAKTPDAIAIEFEGKAVTYTELDRRANQIARHLRSLGVGRNVLVGLCLSRSIEMLAGLLAILKAGGGYLPLDPDYPRARLAFMVEDSGMRVLLAEESTRGVVEAIDSALLFLIDRDSTIVDRYDSSPLNEDSIDDAGTSTAYVIYTSGSTGKPKGVIVPHRSVVNLLESVSRIPGVSDRDTVLAITTLSFDIAVSELLLPLAVGARIVLASRETATDGPRLAALIEDSGVTLIDATPATYRLLIAAGWKGSQRLRLICTGEAMPQDLAVSLVPRARETWNAYGPTETTVWATMYRVESGADPILIGRPIANTTARILDQNQLEVPVGVRGELFVGGAAVTNGYLNRADLTTERFLPDPFVSDSNARMYRTGDVVRLLPDGNIQCLGRTDHQVKVRGYRIELGEIEAALLRDPAVVDAAVAVLQDKGGEPRLAAYLVTAPGTDPKDEYLRDTLRQSLPDHMIPHVFVRLERMPLTASGKIDRNAVSRIEIAKQAQQEFVEATTDTERILAALWKDALGVGRVSIRDDFFALGGHSLLASQLLSRLRTEHGVEVSFRKIFELPTIERLAAFVDASGTAASGLTISPIQHRPGMTTAPVSVLQERLWLLQELDPPQSLVQMHSGAWRLLGALDEDLLEGSLREFARRHEMMRTSFHVQDGVRIQRVAPEIDLTLSRLDLSELEEPERKERLSELYRAQQATAFDLESAPLFRATLIKCGKNDSILYTIRHGMIWDGWSFDIFLKEIEALYQAGVNGVQPVLPALPITYGDYASWQREWAQSPDADRQSSWWRQQLDGDLRALELPTDRPRAAQSVYGGSHVMIRFSREEMETLKSLARRHDTTLFMLALAAYDVLLHRYTGETDLLVGSPARGRMWSETENIIGPFVNTLVFRARLDPSMPFVELLRHVRDVGLESLSHQEMPFELLGKAPPVLRAFFSMQDARSRPSSLAEARIEQVHVPQTSASNDLMLWMMETSESLVAVLNYSTELFDAATAMRMLAQLRTLLLGLVTESTKPIRDLNILPPEELSVLLNQASATPQQVDGSPYDRITSQLRATPDATALEVGGESLTYRQLGDRVTEAAEFLKDLGLGDGAYIGISLDNGCLVPLLATLQCSSNVVLVDGNDPPDYRHKLLAENHVAAIITSKATDELARSTHLPIIGRAAGNCGWQLSGSLGTIFRRQASNPLVMVHAPGPNGEPSTTAIPLSRQAALLSDLREIFELEPTDVVVGLTHMSLDIELTGLLLAMVSGARLVIPPDNVLSSGAQLASFLMDVGATLMIAPMGVWRSLTDMEEWSGGPSFRAVVAGPPQTAADLSSILGRAGRVFTAYGYPETGWAAVHEVKANDSAAIMGRAVGDAMLFVLDEALMPAPIGVPGEIYIGAGSLDASAPRAESATRIVDAHGIGPLFRTGDRGRRLADGTFSFLAADPTRGYVDGHLVEFRATERELESHPSVARAAVLPVKDLSGVTRIVAYIEPRPQSAFTDTELRQRIRRHLPDVMVPRQFVEVESLPTRKNGDVDRSQLRSPFDAEEVDRSFIPPRTESERLLAEIWKDALGVPRVDIRDNFFMLGGSSLMCFRAVEALQRSHGITLGPRALLLGSLEQAAAQMQQAPRSPRQPAMPATPIAGSGALKRFKGLMERKR